MTEGAPLSVHRPAREPRGGIVVVQEAFGVNDHIEDVAGRFAAEGWLAVAPHLFHRTGDPTFSYEDMSEVRTHMGALDAEGVLADIDTALAHLADAGIPTSRTGVVGFCMGGTVTLLTAVHREIGAGVTFYGGGLAEGRFGFRPLIEEATSLRAPWLGLFGDLDKGIPVDQVEELRIAAAASGQPTEIVRYADADHGFHCDARASYHDPSAKDAWRRTLDWFDRYLT
ncbi:MAG: dienelactone hydrolase family protein [Ilumatobacteraceae bacterium]